MSHDYVLLLPDKMSRRIIEKRKESARHFHEKFRRPRTEAASDSSINYFLKEEVGDHVSGSINCS